MSHDEPKPSVVVDSAATASGASTSDATPAERRGFLLQGSALLGGAALMASVPPGIGYAEFAGWVPGGRQMLVAREARGEGRYRRSYDVVDLDTLATQRQAADPAVLGPFQRWQDAGWKRMTVSLR